MTAVEKKFFNFRETFGFGPAHLQVEGFAERSDFVPEEIPGYVHRPEILSDMLRWYEDKDCTDGLQIVGPRGSGKTTGLLQMCAKLNIPVQIIQGNRRLDIEEAKSVRVAIGGDIVSIDGPITTAYREGHLLLIDEFDLIDPGQQAACNAIAERRPITLIDRGGEVVRCHPDFRMVITGNTAGMGDATGGFAGTMMQNIAFLDRFEVIEVGYPDPETEVEIVTSANKEIPRVLAEKMVDVANRIRTLYLGEGAADADGKALPQLEFSLSTRGLLRWARLAVRHKNKTKARLNPVIYALDRAELFRASKESREAVHEIVNAVIGTVKLGD